MKQKKNIRITLLNALFATTCILNHHEEKIMWYKINKNYLWEYLSNIENDICYANATEAPYSSIYHDFDELGIYIDIINWEALFSSVDKYTSHCWWPSFTKPLNESSVEYVNDTSYWMSRIEVRTKKSKIHLGHIFTDWPVDKWGRRFCINWATLDFIPFGKLEAKGYSKYKSLFKTFK